MVVSYGRNSELQLQYRPNFIAENPGMDSLSEINDYTARGSNILRRGRSEVKTALYYPFRTICAGGKPGEDAVAAFEALGNYLEERGVSFDLIDEDFVLGAKKECGTLRGEYVFYENVFVPNGISFEYEAVSSDYSELMANNAFKKGPPVVLSKIGGSIFIH